MVHLPLTALHLDARTTSIAYHDAAYRIDVLHVQSGLQCFTST